MSERKFQNPLGVRTVVDVLVVMGVWAAVSVLSESEVCPVVGVVSGVGVCTAVSVGVSSFLFLWLLRTLSDAAVGNLGFLFGGSFGFS